MPTVVVSFFADCRYEDVLAEADRFLVNAPGNTLAIQLKAQAQYYLGQYDECTAALEEAIRHRLLTEPLEIRLQLAATLAFAMIEQGRYDEVRELVNRTVPEGSSAREEYGEVLLAGAWAEFFAGQYFNVSAIITRVFEIATEDFTCGRAALIAALTSRQTGELHRATAYLVKAQNHLEGARNLFGNPEPIRQLYLAQTQILRRRSGELLGRVTEEAATLPIGSRVFQNLLEAVHLYRRYLAKESVSVSVREALLKGVKRPWLALLPGAAVRTKAPEPAAEKPVPQPVEIPAAPTPAPVEVKAPVPAKEEPAPVEASAPVPVEFLTSDPGPAAAAAEEAPVSELQEKLGRLKVRGDHDATQIRKKKASPGTILLVVPSDWVADSLKNCLHDSTYTIVGKVPSIDQGIEKYVLLRPALVVVDLMAPGATGKAAVGAPSFVKRFQEIDPHCKIMVTYTLQNKYMVMGPMRDGARGELAQPFDRPKVLGALNKALTSRSGVEALRVPTLDLRRPIACSWKPAEGGMGSLLAKWENFVTRSIDPKGVEAALHKPMKTGLVLRLNLELPGGLKPIQTLAEVTSCKEDKPLRVHVTRFTFSKLPDEARDRLVAFITEALAGGQTRGK